MRVSTTTIPSGAQTCCASFQRHASSVFGLPPEFRGLSATGLSRNRLYGCTFLRCRYLPEICEVPLQQKKASVLFSPGFLAIAFSTRLTITLSSPALSALPLCDAGALDSAPSIVSLAHAFRVAWTRLSQHLAFEAKSSSLPLSSLRISAPLQLCINDPPSQREPLQSR